MNIINKKFFATNCLVLMCAIFISLIFFSGNVLAADYPDNQEATILGDHVKATIAYEKDHSPYYTAVGDTVTVNTTLEKLDDGVLPESFNQSSMLVLFPDETQGLKLEGEPTFIYKRGSLSDTGSFVNTSKELHRDIFWAFNAEAQVMYHDTVSYDGRMTELQVTNQYDDGPYDDTYRISNLLINKGDKIILSYKAKVTEEALKNKEFSLHSGIYDSSKGDFDWEDFLTTKMPAIQSINVSFDEESKNKVVDITDANSYHITLTGTWTGNIADLKPTLTVNGQTVAIPTGSFQKEGTFSIPVDLTNIGMIGQNKTQIEIKDSMGQTASDNGILTLVQKNTPPQLQLVDALSNKTIPITPNLSSFKVEGQWKDAESQTGTLYYKLNGVEHLLENSVANANKGTWNVFSQEMSLADLKLGANAVEIYVVDTEGLKSNVATFTLQLMEGTVHFKSVDSVLSFQDAVINGQTVHSLPQKPVDIKIEDTTRSPGNWQLVVSQISTFKNAQRELPAVLSYQNNRDNLVITNNQQVTLPVVKETDTEYGLIQDGNHQFDLAISSNAYIGDYQSELEWTIIEAP
ncbi:hypothetical protein IDE03_002551 [Enterococcus faecalis]|jgi:hypothetical protein|uniref:hypothetical protein n=1 Tax=Enterococcus faecalis TaxID=1351 RepID=UPI00032FD434|nr:hypothetical protein [Enterococcus faecalis]EGO2728455.1 hypothetical protein [Enterococcus faecalis]EGO2809532.1 hypothetical protein [Enterococcus faecalis]EGO6648391.1 hypothetical protein [Enterococcus faecalis]EGO7663330.1 hypothetical protein [Enterococcus faecalis]EGO7894746.1 hypothetical protein [Enterococcus faecalis]